MVRQRLRPAATRRVATIGRTETPKSVEPESGRRHHPGWNEYDSHAKKFHTNVEDGRKILLDNKVSAWKQPSGTHLQKPWDSAAVSIGFHL